MLPTLYDLSFVEERCRDLRRQAAAHRLVHAPHLALVPGPGLLDVVRALLARLHVIRPVAGRADAAA